MMKTKIQIFISIVLIACFLACSGKKDKNEEETAKQLPAELLTLNQKIIEEPGNASNYNERAEYFLKVKDFNNAMNDISMALNIDSTNAKYYITLSNIFLATGNFGQCKNVLEKTITLDPGNEEAYLKLAELYFYRPDYQKTLEFIQKTLEVNKNNPSAYFLRAFVRKETGDTVAAIKDLQLAVANNDEFYEAYLWLGILHAYQKNDLAIDYYNNALDVKPRSTEAYYNLAMYYQGKEKYNKAIEIYTTILKIEPKNKYAHYNLAYIHLEFLSIFDMAVKYFTEAINDDPGYVEAYFGRGLSYERMGDVMMAREDYKKALELKPDYEKAITGLNRLDAAERMMMKK